MMIELERLAVMDADANEIIILESSHQLTAGQVKQFHKMWAELEKSAGRPLPKLVVLSPGLSLRVLRSTVAMQAADVAPVAGWTP